MKTFLPYFLICLYFLFSGPAFSQDYLMPANVDGRYGYIDSSGTMILREKFEAAFPFSEGVAAVEYYGKWGYIDKSGAWVLEMNFTDAKPFSDGLACVKSDDKWGFIDHSGKWIIEPQFRAVSSFSEGKAVIFSDKGFQYIDKEQKDVFNNEYQIAKPFAEGAAFVISNDRKGFIDNHGNWLFNADFDEVYSFSEGMAMVMKSGKSGFINRRGVLKIPLVYNDATQFSQGMASVKINNKWGYINRAGRVIIKPNFDYAGTFNYDHAIARINGKYGLINLSGEWEIDPGFRDLGDLSKTNTLRSEVENLVTLTIRQWEFKGEFEKTADYLQRVTKENRDMEIQAQTRSAIRILARKYVHLDQVEPGLYNADAEMYNIVIPGALPTLLPVPINDAKWVRDNWNEINIDGADYSIYGDQFLVTKLTCSIGDKHYSYDATINGVPATVFQITSDLGEIVVSMPDYPVIMRKDERVLRNISGTSDVDISIPVNPQKQDKIFAVIIGNEDYSTYQVNGDREINVDYADLDARTFKEYMKKTFGVPEENITLLINATAGQINQSMAKLSALAKAYKGEAELIFYYAGHGLPDEKTREPYLIPVDVAGSDLSYAISLENLFNKLTENESKRVTVFLDACFSGGGRNEGLVASRGIRIKPKSPFVLGSLIVFSATSSDQTAYAFNEKGHGMFTYHLLKKFQETQGKLTYGDLADYLSDEVNKKSLLFNNKEQIPTIKVSPVFEYNWKDFTFLPPGTIRK